MFVFNASLSDALPLSPMLFAVDLMRMEKSGLLIDAICVLFILSSPLRFSFVSVVFDFNASLNDVAPVSPMSLPIYSKQHKIHETAFVKTVRLTISCKG